MVKRISVLIMAVLMGLALVVGCSPNREVSNGPAKDI